MICLLMQCIFSPEVRTVIINVTVEPLGGIFSVFQLLRTNIAQYCSLDTIFTSGFLVMCCLLLYVV